MCKCGDGTHYLVVSSQIRWPLGHWGEWNSIINQISTYSTNYNAMRTNYIYEVWNPKIQFLIHKDFPIILILSRINPISGIDTSFFKTISILSYHPQLGLPRSLFTVDLLKFWIHGLPTWFFWLYFNYEIKYSTLHILIPSEPT